MIVRPVRDHPITEAQLALWDAFCDHYAQTGTRGEVDRFLRALVGAPRG